MCPLCLEQRASRVERVSEVPVCSVLPVLPGRWVQGWKLSPSDPGGSVRPGWEGDSSVQRSWYTTGSAGLCSTVAEESSSDRMLPVLLPPGWHVQNVPQSYCPHIFHFGWGGRQTRDGCGCCVGEPVFPGTSVVTGMSATGGDVKIWRLLTRGGRGYIIGGHGGHLRGCLCSAVWKGAGYNFIVWVTFLPHPRCVGIREEAFMLWGSSTLRSSDGTESDFQVVRLGQSKFRRVWGAWTGRDHVVKATIVTEDSE